MRPDQAPPPSATAHASVPSLAAPDPRLGSPAAAPRLATSRHVVPDRSKPQFRARTRPEIVVLSDLKGRQLIAVAACLAEARAPSGPTPPALSTSASPSMGQGSPNT